jgi:hypothetical protein
MNLTRHTYTSRSEKTLHFLAGFFGWFILNVAIGGVLSLAASLVSAAVPSDNTNAQNIPGMVFLVLSCLVLLLNIGLLIYFGFTRYWIALGALAGFATGLLITLCLGLLLAGTCYVVFNGGGLFPTPTP